MTLKELAQKIYFEGARAATRETSRALIEIGQAIEAHRCEAPPPPIDDVEKARVEFVDAIARHWRGKLRAEDAVEAARRLVAILDAPADLEIGNRDNEFLAEAYLLAHDLRRRMRHAFGDGTVWFSDMTRLLDLLKEARK